MISQNKKQHYAYDLSKNVLSKGEVYDDEAIKQSIEMILSTMFGERLFNPSFGCELPYFTFEQLTESSGERLLSSIINSIRKFEDRVEISDNDCSMNLYPDQNAISLKIVYAIKRNNTISKFEKKILF